MPVLVMRDVVHVRDITRRRGSPSTVRFACMGMELFVDVHEHSIDLKTLEKVRDKPTKDLEFFEGRLLRVTIEEITSAELLADDLDERRTSFTMAEKPGGA